MMQATDDIPLEKKATGIMRMAKTQCAEGGQPHETDLPFTFTYVDD